MGACFTICWRAAPRSGNPDLSLAATDRASVPLCRRSLTNGGGTTAAEFRLIQDFKTPQPYNSRRDVHPADSNPSLVSLLMQADADHQRQCILTGAAKGHPREPMSGLGDKRTFKRPTRNSLGAGLATNVGSRQRVEQRFRLFEVGVEPLGEPAVDRGEKIAGFGMPALAAYRDQPGSTKQAGHGHEPLAGIRGRTALAETDPPLQQSVLVMSENGPHLCSIRSTFFKNAKTPASCC